MRFLHTSDWHLGKPLRHLRRDREFEDVLQEILDVARMERVDCLLVAGDLFDSVAPPAEAERMAFEFSRELYGAGIQAVVIAGNHDHQRRLTAFGRVLDLVGIHVRAEPSQEGAVVGIRGRDGEEAAVAVLPWVPERRVRTWEAMRGAGVESFQQYADVVADLLDGLERSLPRNVVRIIMAHLFVEGGIVGGEGAGERPLHLGQVYAVKRQRLPYVDYMALGHLHRPQAIRPRPPVYYSGSILQLDFGEVGQRKCVYLVDVSPGKEAHVEEVPLTKPRPLYDLGSPKTPLTMEQVRAEVKARGGELTQGYVRVFLRAEGLSPSLVEEVRKAIPTAVEVKVMASRPKQEVRPSVRDLSPIELFTLYHRQEQGGDPPGELVRLFQELMQEVHEAP